MASWRSPLNAVAFGLRAALRFRRGVPQLRDETKSNLFDYLEAEVADTNGRTHAERRATELAQRYGLAPLKRASTRLDYCDNLYLLDALETLLGDNLLPRPDVLRAVDVGAKNWSYVFGLERFLAHGGAPVALTGIEIDGHGIYPDLHARCDYARAYARQTGNDEVVYQVMDFLEADITGAHVVTNFYPFLRVDALLRWGLPGRMFQPERMIERCLAALAEDGVLIVFNQTRAERDVLHQLLQRAGGRVVRSVPLRSHLVAYHEMTFDRWATLARPSGHNSARNSAD